VAQPPTALHEGFAQQLQRIRARDSATRRFVEYCEMEAALQEMVVLVSRWRRHEAWKLSDEGFSQRAVGHLAGISGPRVQQLMSSGRPDVEALLRDTSRMAS